MRIFRTASPVVLLALGTLSACSDEVTAPAASPGEASRYTAPGVPVNGELVKQSGTSTVYLVYNQTLYGIPDMQTLRACSGGRDRVVREVSTLPAWSRSTLPSAGNPETRPHGRAWMHGDNPVRNSTGTVYLVVGCVKSGIPNPDVYHAIFNGDWSRIRDVADADLNALPTGPIAQPIPLRRAGSLVETGGTIEWVTFHGGSLGIPDPATMDSHCRGWAEMASGTEANAYAINGILQPGSYSCVRGNEYPYQNASMSGSDPWQFVPRNCTSFVAWRLNQDGIEFHNYFRQPAGYRWGNADLWDEAAGRAGLVVNKTPRVGAVAQWNSMHVAYVAAVHTNGDVTLEEYNAGYPSNPGLYSSRRVSPSVVENFIHFR